jgi:hypothetical protein
MPNNPTDWIRLFGPAAVSALATLIASFSGAWLALGRFRRERAFDRRLDWYERTIRLFHDLSTKLSLLRGNTIPSKSAELNRELAELIVQLPSAVAEAKIYSTKKSYDLMVATSNLLDRFAADFQAQASAGLTPKQIAERICDEVGPLFDSAGSALADEARQHLGLGKVQFASLLVVKPHR